MKIKVKHKINCLDDLEISKRMRKDKIYYHCCYCGNVYEDKNKTILITNMNELNNKNSIPREFNDYRITSGVCKKCFEGLLK